MRTSHQKWYLYYSPLPQSNKIIDWPSLVCSWALCRCRLFRNWCRVAECSADNTGSRTQPAWAQGDKTTTSTHMRLDYPTTAWTEATPSSIWQWDSCQRSSHPDSTRITLSSSCNIHNQFHIIYTDNKGTPIKYTCIQICKLMEMIQLPLTT